MRRISTYLFTILMIASINASAQSGYAKHVLPEEFCNAGSDLKNSGRAPWGHGTRFSLDLRDSCTVLTFGLRIDSSYQEVWLGGDETFILDMATGVRYAATEAMRGAKLNAYNVIYNHKGDYIRFQIKFPKMKMYVDRDISKTFVKIYGVPEAGLVGGQEYCLEDIRCVKLFDWSRFPELNYSPLTAYNDSEPVLKQPRIVSRPAHYVYTDTATYTVYTDLPKVYPLTQREMEDNSVAFWTTPSATYVTQIVEIKHFRTVFGFNKNCVQISIPNDFDDNTEPTIESLYTTPFPSVPAIEPVSTAPYPSEGNFIVEATPGDFVVFTMEFPPLPIGTNDVDVFIRNRPNIVIPSQKEEEMMFGKCTTVGVWRDNQRLVRPLVSTNMIVR